jgi:hypothetical protein
MAFRSGREHAMAGLLLEVTQRRDAAPMPVRRDARFPANLDRRSFGYRPSLRNASYKAAESVRDASVRNHWPILYTERNTLVQVRKNGPERVPGRALFSTAQHAGTRAALPPCTMGARDSDDIRAGES